jgi:hypothetical protein
MADVPTVELSGPLGPFAAGFVDDMRRQGFARWRCASTRDW